MTSYNEECLALIPGSTPKKKYEWVQKRLDEIKIRDRVLDTGTPQEYIERYLQRQAERRANKSGQIVG